MAYVQDRLVHDADSHLMELPDCLDPFFNSKLLARFHDLPAYKKKNWRPEASQRVRDQQADAEFRATAQENILLRKNYQALGAFMKEDRPRRSIRSALPASSSSPRSALTISASTRPDMELAYARGPSAQPHDGGFLRRRSPLAGHGVSCRWSISTRAEAAARRKRSTLGAKALLVPSQPPQHHSPSHIELDPVWAMAQERGIPILFHVGDEEKLNAAVFRERPAAREGLPRRRGKLHLGLVHADPACGDEDDGRADH